MSSSAPQRPRPVVLLVLDGWGIGQPGPHNAITETATPNYKALMDCPHTELGTSGQDVGLPEGQMGNSEVGHINLGAGRIVYQDYMRINKAIEDGSFSTNPALLNLIATVKASGGRLHTLGLTSPGGVHSALPHLYAFLKMAKAQGVAQVFHHALMDGRDTPPSSGLGYIRDVEREMAALGIGKIATVAGRYWGMDRDNRWDRVQKFYDAVTQGVGESAPNAEAAMQQSYDKGKTDEFVLPTVLQENGQPVALIRDGDGVFCLNFRPDRVREISAALTQPGFSGFPRAATPRLAGYVCMTSYSADLHLSAAFEEDRSDLTLGKLIAGEGMRQLRIAETEKYAHVTYFFNGGREEAYPGEDRVMVPSPREVATYDEKPEMSLPEVCEKLCAAIRSRQYDFILANFANPDMVGHTGVLGAAKRAVAAIDDALGKVHAEVKAAGGALLLTADHGNIEKMWDEESKGPHSAHTTNRVPLIIAGVGPLRLRPGILADVAPTLLGLMGLPKPVGMTARNLVQSA